MTGLKINWNIAIFAKTHNAMCFRGRRTILNTDIVYNIFVCWCIVISIMDLTVAQFEKVETSITLIRHSGMFCCVPGCTSSRLKSKSLGKTVAFYHIPIDAVRRRVWLASICHDGSMYFFTITPVR